MRFRGQKMRFRRTARAKNVASHSSRPSDFPVPNNIDSKIIGTP